MPGWKHCRFMQIPEISPPSMEVTHPEKSFTSHHSSPKFLIHLRKRIFPFPKPVPPTYSCLCNWEIEAILLGFSRWVAIQDGVLDAATATGRARKQFHDILVGSERDSHSICRFRGSFRDSNERFHTPYNTRVV